MAWKFFLFAITFTAFGFCSAQSRLDSLLTVLDQVIEKEQFYQKEKEQQLSALKKHYFKKNSPSEYNLKVRIAREYQVYIADSAKKYAAEALQIAKTLNDPGKINESLILQASTEGKAGLFQHSLEILDAINFTHLQKDLRIPYYKAYTEAYIYWGEYQQGENSDQIIYLKNKVTDSLIASVPKDSYEYALNYATRNIELRNFAEARRVLDAYFPKVKKDTRDFSIFTSIYAYLYQNTGDKVKQKEYLALSATSDIRAAIKENVSLRTLAMLLYEDGDIHRANTYIKKSLADANFFNARLRNLQISRVLPQIDKAYTIIKNRHEKTLQNMLVLVSALSAVLLIAVYLVFSQMKKTSRARKALEESNLKLVELNGTLTKANEKERNMNIHLAEANQIKEQYIHSFLEICTVYMNRLDSFKTTVSRKIKTGQTAELLKIIESNSKASQDLRDLYQNFDKAFLNVYPDFVMRVNQLLKPEEQYTVKSVGELNHELRVYAMIRLGVTENGQIATFLHYSLRTVYNYRSKVKSKATLPENFEENILRIGTQFEQEK